MRLDLLSLLWQHHGSHGVVMVALKLQALASLRHSPAFSKRVSEV